MNLSQAEEYFKKYHEKLIWETQNTRAHLELWERLERYKSSHLKELNQAPHFFTFTIKAHLDDALLTLSRIVDRRLRHDPLSIWKFLNFVEQNYDMFSTEAFCQRMMQKPNYDEHWTKSHEPITIKEINEDRQRLTSLENVISNIEKWRDKVIAHIDLKVVTRNKVISKEYPLKLQQLQEVIDTLFRILNRYSSAFESTSYTEQFVGEDDIQYVIGAISFKIQERRKQLEILKKQARDGGV
ncbi:MAG: hypothetical protein A2Z76_04790 [Chloroflexi bacterium RBG_13_56_8b]|nr:MAG: hypothetical protein A2Z76_04790 [Chloroflexi bacterium RBG_13_56_8b]